MSKKIFFKILINFISLLRGYSLVVSSINRKDLGDFLSVNYYVVFAVVEIFIMIFGCIDKGRICRVGEVINLFCKGFFFRFNILRV